MPINEGRLGARRAQSAFLLLRFSFPSLLTTCRKQPKFLASQRHPQLARATATGSPAHVIYTIGHSTRPLEEFLRILRENGVRLLVDVRTIPRSRHNPQYNRETLAPFLRNRRIGYRHMKELGGLRHSHAGSPNTGWRNASFRGFADYMESAEFAAAVTRLITLGRTRVTAIMCAEAVPWRCHRSLIADALVVRGVAVKEIIGPGTTRPHELNPMAVVHGTGIRYPEPGHDPAHAS